MNVPSKVVSYLSCGSVAAALLITGSLVLAQTQGTTAARKSGSIIHSDMNASKDIAVDHAGGNGVQGSTGTHNTGENPLFESKGKTDLKQNAGASNVQPYKDPEDMTTRYRPGNNKTASQTPSSSSSGPADTRSKHLAGVKYSDRSASAKTGSSSTIQKTDSSSIKQR
ncbi:MAG: hypothetical protein ABI286_07300 [Edaphobacter sp.]